MYLNRIMYTLLKTDHLGAKEVPKTWCMHFEVCPPRLFGCAGRMYSRSAIILPTTKMILLCQLR